MTRYSPAAVGCNVMNAETRSSRWTKLAGARPATMSQKMHGIWMSVRANHTTLAADRHRPISYGAGTIARRARIVVQMACAERIIVNHPVVLSANSVQAKKKPPELLTTPSFA
jgi:hypothetical protein